MQMSTCAHPSRTHRLEDLRGELEAHTPAAVLDVPIEATSATPGSSAGGCALAPQRWRAARVAVMCPWEWRAPSAPATADPAPPPVGWQAGGALEVLGNEDRCGSLCLFYGRCTAGRCLLIDA